MAKIRTLLADDHAVVRAGIRNALNDIHEIEIVGEVGDGPSVFSRLADTHPDCLLIDVTMPDFEPIKAIRQIRQQYPAIKILVISAYDNDYYVRGLLGAGVNGYHLKDQPLSDLRLAVRRVLAGERWVSSRLLNKLVNHADTSPPLLPLTTRQREILRLLQQGLDNQTIAHRMSLSIKTIENHLTRIYKRLNVQSRLEAVNYVFQHPEILGVSGRQVAQTDVTVNPARTKTVNILLVDDNALYRHQLQRMVGKVSPFANIYEAENMAEALHLVKQVALQLVLMDVILGEESGIVCTQRIKAVAPLTRVVLMSAYPDRGFRRMGAEAGAIAFLDKRDLDTAALRQVVNDIIG
jgi:DNA-binding NarL/FixJ family response regulator